MFRIQAEKFSGFFIAALIFHAVKSGCHGRQCVLEFWKYRLLFCAVDNCQEGEECGTDRNQDGFQGEWFPIDLCKIFFCFFCILPAFVRVLAAAFVDEFCELRGADIIVVFLFSAKFLQCFAEGVEIAGCGQDAFVLFRGGVAFCSLYRFSCSFVTAQGASKIYEVDFSIFI